LSAAAAKGPTTLREIDTAFVDRAVDKPRTAAVHLEESHDESPGDLKWAFELGGNLNALNP
jgi:hypothetical protein